MLKIRQIWGDWLHFIEKFFNHLVVGPRLNITELDECLEVWVELIISLLQRILSLDLSSVHENRVFFYVCNTDLIDPAVLLAVTPTKNQSKS